MSNAGIRAAANSKQERSSKRNAQKTFASGAMSGLAIALGPLIVLGAMALYQPDFRAGRSTLFPWWLIVAAVSGVLAVLGGVALWRSRKAGVFLAALAVAGFMALSIPAVSNSPALSLALLLPVLAAVLRFFGPLRPIENLEPVQESDPKGRQGAATAVSAVALLAWFLVVPARAAHGPLAAGLVLLSVLLALVFGAVWLISDERIGRLRRVLIFLVFAAAATLAVLARNHRLLALTSLVPIPIAILIAIRGAARRASSDRLDTGGLWDILSSHPARLLAFTFLALIALGSVLLALPLSAPSGPGIRFIDAAFTAVSATCVTGLTVVDTAAAFSINGQAVIMALIQFGGLGIMTFYTAGLLLFRRRIAIKQEAVMTDLLGGDNRTDLGRALRQVLVMTFSFEILGAAALAALFKLGGDSPGASIWQGAFTAVSAFCNAGFSLSSSNLAAYQRNPAVLHIVAGLIIAGGLGPAAIAAIPDLVRRRRAPLQAKVALTVSAALLAAGTILFAAFEWTGSLAGLGPIDRIHNAWFQSVTTRTAGFNSVDLTAIGPATATVFIVLMFIGGSPGSTAGGIKTTTAAILVSAVRAALKGRPYAAIFNRKVPHFAVYKAAAITALYAVAAIAAVTVLMLTQRMEPLTAMFEAVSALGTVGLTIGGTAALDGVGKIVIMLCMFLGRVGPLTLFMVLSDRDDPGRLRLPEEDLSTG